jgi:propanol-preferring alcohol dehydrogenase
MAVTSEQPGTYRAAVVHQFREPVTIDRVRAHELAPGQVRVKVEASGLCHTDIHAARVVFEL